MYTHCIKHYFPYILQKEQYHHFYKTLKCFISYDRVTIVDLCASIVQTEKRAWVLVKTRQKHKVTVGVG